MAREAEARSAILQVPAATLGLLVAPQGVGGLLAGLTVAWFIARMGETKTFALGLATLGVGITPLTGSSLTAVLVGMVAVGLGVTWTVVAFITLRQRLTPHVYRAVPAPRPTSRSTCPKPPSPSPGSACSSSWTTAPC
ncbi:MAG: hypothetical protein ACR2FV_09065 [Ornithinimicrobium sp.]|uniref:hypothetical protein n=1 Tax=Ornithinimicrobium sp. TaxID=1977084 RepID=UPI003D9BA95D